MAMLPLGLLARKTSSVLYQPDGDYHSGRFIDQAILDEKANVKKKTWRYRGNICTTLLR